MNNTKTNTKLTIEDVAIYLPYGLKYMTQGEEYIFEMKGLCGLWAHSLCDHDSFIEDMLPILNPLSQLTGKEYYRLTGKTPENNFSVVFGSNHIDGDYLYLMGYTSKKVRLNDLENLPHVIFMELISLKFDMYNLIGQGLAISTEDIKEKVYE